MRFPKTMTALAATLAFVSCQPSYADVVGAMGGHWSKHLLSETVTNEKHAWGSFRYNWFTIGRFDNSFKRPGFSGESYHVGVMHDFEILDNYTTGGDKVVVRLSGGLTYGYTTLAGHDASSKDLTPYLAGGFMYQTPVGNDGVNVEGGLMFMGDAALPAAGVFYRF